MHETAPTENGSAGQAAAARPGRRTFLQWFTYGLSGLAAALLGVPLLGYFLLVRKGREEWIALGKVSAFPRNATRLAKFTNPLRQPWDGMTAHTEVFVRRLDGDAQRGEQFLVFAVNCAHLGCPVTWFPQSGLFMCPCHGGVYYADGERASGPPPRGLYHCVWRVRAGKLEIQAPRYPSLQSPLTKQEGNG